jgi:hypothetical protein
MPGYLLLMHNDATVTVPWPPYLAALRKSGNFEGGSAIGAGVCMRKTGVTPSTSEHLTGFIRISANNLEHAQSLVIGNPVYEGGGTVEIRALPETD